MLLMEALQEHDKLQNNKNVTYGASLKNNSMCHLNKPDDNINFDLIRFFRNSETDIKILKRELNQIKEVYNNINLNIEVFLTGNISQMVTFYATLCHFNEVAREYKKNDAYINNGVICWITSEHKQTVKDIKKYLRLIIMRLEKEAKEDYQKKLIKQLRKKYLKKS